MAEPNNYITATQKNFIFNDNEGRMVEKCIVEIQGTFLVKIRNDAFNGSDGENAYEHINKFLKIVGPIKINGLTQDRFRLSIFPVSLAGAAMNAHEIAPFNRMEIFGRGPYAHIKTEWASNPYLDINRTFGRDYEGNNIGCTQENQEHKGDLIPEPSNYKVRRFEMIKYSIDDDEEYITIKEFKHLKHSKDYLNAYRELLCLINEG
ncbi:hypothetical protein Tco_0526005 [Tanacetum coccineum]